MDLWFRILGLGYDLSYANRSIGPSHISFGARGFKSTSLVRIYPDGGGENSDFEGDSSGGSIDFGRPLDRKNRIDLRLSSTDNRFTHESGPVLTPTDLIDNAIQDGRANSARLSFTHDTRFDPFSPREGRYERFATEWGGGMLGGEFSYGKQTIDFRTYHPMGEKWVFASRYTGGIIGGSAPATTLFWVGGANSLRGYEVGEQKGKFMALSNVEFRYSPPDSPYGLVAFVDMGTTSNEWKSLSFKNPLIGAGIGFRMQVGFFGVAPIRFDLGYNFEDGNTQFHFSVGHLF
ncbi:BamA/TamA family outer membrane protein [bacterium]|nr:BamA/TamA family outer membrane protein [bacterium]